MSWIEMITIFVVGLLLSFLLFGLVRNNWQFKKSVQEVKIIEKEDIVMKYEIIVASGTDVIEREIESRLIEGWKLQGGVSMCVNSNSGLLMYSQAMTNEEKGK